MIKKNNSKKRKSNKPFFTRKLFKKITPKKPKKNDPEKTNIKKPNIKNKSAKRGTIRIRLIVIPLILVLLGVTAIGFTSSYLTRASLLREMEESGFRQSAEFLNRLEENNTSLEIINGLLDDRIRAAGNIVKINGSGIGNTLLKRYARELGIDEINYFDPDGKIIYSTHNDYIGTTAEEAGEAHKFRSSNVAEYMGEIRQNTVTGEYFKYGYISNSYAGFIQVGVAADRINDLTDAFSYQTLISEIALSDDIAYATLVDRDMQVIAHSDEERIGLTLDNPDILYSNTEEVEHAVKTYYAPAGVDVYSVSVPAIIDGRNIGTINIGYSMAGVQSAIRRNVTVSIATGLAIFLILAFALYASSRDVINVINRLKGQLSFMADGDFSREVPKDLTSKNDELGEISMAIAAMQSAMQDVIRNILEAAQILASSAEELTATSQQSAMAADEVAKVIEDISQGAADQANETEQGVISISDLGDLVTQNRVYIERLDATAEKVDQLKDEGLRILEELIDQTNLSKESTSQVQAIIGNTNDSAGQIAVASEMIQSIADQTNLLALNATIEAARTGEAGRGFAVVANEIKQLADQSTEFTGEINSIINELTQKTASAVETMKTGAEVIAQQSAHVTTTSNQFDGIAQAIDDMKEVIDFVNKSSDDMARQKEEIVNIMEQLSAISEQNAAGSQEASASVEEQTASTEEIANSSDDLAKLAEELNERVSIFKI